MLPVDKLQHHEPQHFIATPTNGNMFPYLYLWIAGPACISDEPPKFSSMVNSGCFTSMDCLLLGVGPVTDHNMVDTSIYGMEDTWHIHCV